MDWFRSDYVKCIGFPRAVLPYIGKAIENEEVEWIERELQGNTLRGRFLWLDCEWKISESFMNVQLISLLEGKIDHQDLTAAVLRG